MAHEEKKRDNRPTTDNEYTCTKYCKRREKKDVEGCLTLLSKNAVIIDKDGHKHVGLEEIKKYLTDNYISVSYTAPERVTENLYKVKSTAYWVIHKTAYFHFNSKGKIKTITIE